jgi:hypothetical protein
VQFRTIVDAIPPVLRPIVLLVLPVIVLHTLFARSPGTAGLVPPTRKLSTNAPKPVDAAELIGQSEAFRAPKHASFPASGRLEDLQRYPLFNALRSTRRLTSESLLWTGSSSEVQPELTADARYELGTNLTQDARDITVIIAKKEFVDIVVMEPAAQSTRVSFRWKWTATNHLARALDLPLTPVVGTASFQRDADTRWRIVQIDVNDATPDLSRPR